jgi:hypothetical protein
MFGFKIITLTATGEMALSKALEENREQSVMKRITFRKVIRQEVVSKKPLCVIFQVVSKALLRAYKNLPDDYLKMIFGKYAGDVMKGNGATIKDYDVEVLR